MRSCAFSVSEVLNTCQWSTFMELNCSWECKLGVHSGGPGSLLIPRHLYPISSPLVRQVVGHSLSSFTAADMGTGIPTQFKMGGDESLVY